MIGYPGQSNGNNPGSGKPYIRPGPAVMGDEFYQIPAIFDVWCPRASGGQLSVGSGGTMAVAL
jgi:hypothetical protein